MKKEKGKWFILFGVCLACFALVRLIIGVRDINPILFYFEFGIFITIIGVLLLVLMQILKKSEGVKKENPNLRTLKSSFFLQVIIVSLSEHLLQLYY